MNLVVHDYNIDSMSSEVSKYHHKQKLLKAPYIDKAGITIQVKPQYMLPYRKRKNAGILLKDLNL